MTVAQKPLAQLTEEALHLLIRELGIVSALRFINQFSLGQGNYTEDRRRWVDQLSLDEIVQKLAKHKE